MFLWNLQQSYWCLVPPDDQVSCTPLSSYDGLTVSGNNFRRVRDVDMKRDYAFVVRTSSLLIIDLNSVASDILYGSLW